MIEVKATQNFKAPIEQIWKIITDHKGSERWPGINKVEIEKEGDDHPNGIGCIRKVWADGMFVKEKITRFDHFKQMDYLVIETDLPIIHHGGSIKMSEENNQVKVIWTSKLEIDSKNPVKKWIAGMLIPRKGNKGFQKALDWIKAELEA